MLGLILIAAIAGMPPRGGIGDLPTGLWAQLRTPAVLLVAASAATLWSAYALRRYLLWRRAITPGPIVLHEVRNGTLDADLPLRELGFQLQQHLTRVHLKAAEVSGGAPSVEFIQLLKETELDPKRPFGLLGGILSLAVPTHAYEIRVTLLDRAGVAPCGAVAEVLVIPSRTSTVIRHWESSWERAIERTAHAIAAEVLPRTRLCVGAWEGWRWRALPHSLFDEYEQARRKLQDRRFDEALGHFFAALRLEAGNRYIRFELGMAQEKLALWLDALLTYYRSFDDAGVGRRPARTVPGRRIVRRVDLLARYRFMMLLGIGEQLARQWVTTGTPADSDDSAFAGRIRDEERREIRRQLREILSERYVGLPAVSLSRLGFEPSPSSGPDRERVRVELRRLLADPVPGRRKQDMRRSQEEKLRVLFEVLAQEEARRFLHDTRYQRFLRMKTGISRLALEIAAKWAARRCERFRGDRLLLPGNAELELPARIFGRRIARRLKRSRNYLVHYNAACAYAVSLLQMGPRSGRLDSRERIAITRCAVRELRRAVQVADSGVLAGRWDWIASEDPDLAELRKTDEFRSFEMECFPSSDRAPVRPAEVHHLEIARHSALLVSVAARRIEREWHQRGMLADRRPAVDVHEVQDWWREELANWTSVRRLAVDHRDWRTRRGWILRINAFSQRHGQEPFVVAHPRYADDPLPVANPRRSDVDDMAVRHVKAATTRLIRLGEVLADASDINDTDGDDRFTWGHHLHDLDERGKPIECRDLRALCHARAALWAGLALWFERPVDSRESVESAAAPLHNARKTLLGPAPPGPRRAPGVAGRRRPGSVQRLRR